MDLSMDGCIYIYRERGTCSIPLLKDLYFEGVGLMQRAKISGEKEGILE